MTRAFLETIKTVGCAGGRETGYGELLYGLVRTTQPDTILEIGSWYGYSALYMAEACKDNKIGRLYAVDDWSLSKDSRPAIEEALHFAQLTHLVTLINGDSLQIEWPKVIDFAFLDGNHSYEYVKAETERAISREAKTIVLHDSTSWEGIARYVAELRSENGIVRLNEASFTSRIEFDILELSKFHGLTVLQKREPKPKPTFTEAEHPAGYLT